MPERPTKICPKPAADLYEAAHGEEASFSTVWSVAGHSACTPGHWPAFWALPPSVSS
jgi:hypothetical protein